MPAVPVSVLLLRTDYLRAVTAGRHSVCCIALTNRALLLCIDYPRADIAGRHSMLLHCSN
jgi:hypothetical protein